MKLIKFANGEDIKLENIYCIGQNYSEHNKEMGTKEFGDVVIFMKPTSAVIYNNEEVIIPYISNNMHHEVEMLIAIGKNGYDITPEQAKYYIAGVGIGVDLTLRDVQNVAKENKKPWGIAKGFYTSAPISDFVDISELSSFHHDLTLEVNGEIRQKGNTADMMRSVEELVSYISKVFSLQRGDLIFTGTPAGVSRLQSGDKVRAILGEGLAELSFGVR